MPQGDITAAWTEGPETCIAVAVQESPDHRVEYLARVVSDGLAGRSPAERRELLRQAVKHACDTQRPIRGPVAGVTGTLAL